MELFQRRRESEQINLDKRLALFFFPFLEMFKQIAYAVIHVLIFMDSLIKSLIHYRKFSSPLRLGSQAGCLYKPQFQALAAFTFTSVPFRAEPVSTARHCFGREN